MSSSVRLIINGATSFLFFSDLDLYIGYATPAITIPANPRIIPGTNILSDQTITQLIPKPRIRAPIMPTERERADADL